MITKELFEEFKLQKKRYCKSKTLLYENVFTNRIALESLDVMKAHTNQYRNLDIILID